MNEKRQISLLLAAALFFCAVLVLYTVFFKEPVRVYEVSLQSETVSFSREDTGLPISAGLPAANSRAEENIKININTATLLQLIQLPGIGEKTADAILAYRKENGGFQKVEELLEVDGIGEKKFRQIEEFITVEE